MGGAPSARQPHPPTCPCTLYYILNAPTFHVHVVYTDTRILSIVPPNIPKPSLVAARRHLRCYATRAWEGRSASTGGSAATARTAAAAAFASTGGGAAGARTAATAAAPVIFLEATEVEEFDGVGRRSQMSGSPRCQHSWLVGREAFVSARVSVESLTHSRTSTRCRRPTEFLQTKNLSCPPKCQELL